MNTEQLEALLTIAEDAAKRSPMPHVHIDAESCVQLVREVLEARQTGLNTESENDRNT